MNTWSDDPTDDLAWNNYAAGFDAALTDRLRGGPVVLVGIHTQPYIDGYADGWDIFRPDTVAVADRSQS